MIGILIFPDFQLLDAAGPIAAFEIAARFANNPPAIKTIAVKAGPVRSSSGVAMSNHFCGWTFQRATLIIRHLCLTGGACTAGEQNSP